LNKPAKKVNIRFMNEEESLKFDAVIIGAGPAGLSTAIRLKQKNPELEVAVFEKGSQVGAHILSGAVFNPEALNDLLPDWQAQDAPVRQPVTQEYLHHFDKNSSHRAPMLPQQKSKHCYIISLGELCQWLAEQAEALGVAIFPGFAIAEALYSDDRSAVIGVKTQAMGLDKRGEPTDQYQPSMAVYARHVFVAEGARGSTAERIIEHFELRKDCAPQHYGIGIKEKWRINPDKHQAGRIDHSVAWPIPSNTYGGGFLYHAENNELIIGLIVALNSPDPRLDPYLLLQQYKSHPDVAPLLEGGECIGYGARAINEGGWQSIPQCHFPGGSLIGCSAGFVNVAEIKGIHHAMRSGIIAADAYLNDESEKLTHLIKQSKTGKALYRGRNIYPAFRFGAMLGMLYSGIDQFIFRGKAPWTLQAKIPDYQKLKPTHPPELKKASFKADSTLPQLTLVSLTHTHHRENQPIHLQLKDPDLPMQCNWPNYSGPEQYYCPAGVYEYVEADGQLHLQINGQNCIHCKTCDIRDPKQNIRWTVPEGGDGPNYVGM
jgi:electron-transferring-flavoprotein dehydrogenase